ncbi:MAG: ECF-type sigma factor [Planctomycetota bacterium]
MAAENLPFRSMKIFDGREVAGDELIELVYEDLQRMARARLERQAPGMTLQPTALVHEVYLKLADQREREWQNRAHFLAIAATAMRRVLLNSARDRARQKRGGAWERVTLSSGVMASDVDAVDALDFEAALAQLENVKERYARIVELRCFAGLGLEEIADTLGVGRTAVVRDWAKAKAWLRQLLEEGEDVDPA